MSRLHRSEVIAILAGSGSVNVDGDPSTDVDAIMAAKAETDDVNWATGGTTTVQPNRGVATIPDGQSTVTVNHGLTGVPTLADIFVTNTGPNADADNAFSVALIDDGAVAFSISQLVSGNGDMQYAWQAWEPAS